MAVVEIPTLACCSGGPLALPWDTVQVDTQRIATDLRGAVRRFHSVNCTRNEG